MSKAVSYVECDLDYCALEYGVAPCQANLGAGWPTGGTVAKVFGSSVGYYAIGGALTITNSKKITVAGAIRIDAGDGVATYFLYGASAIGGAILRHAIYTDPSNRLHFVFRNSSNVDVLEVVKSGFDATGQWSYFVLSADLSDSNKRHLIINGVEETATWANYVDDTIDFSIAADWSAGARPDGGSNFEGAVGYLWMEGDLYIDLSIPANLALFFATYDQPVPVYPGANGELITGSPPALFLMGSDWETNLGSGEDFVESGTAPTEIPFAVNPRKCFNTLKTCQDRANFDNLPVTIRFAKDASYLPDGVEAIENLEEVQFTPTRISLGEDLGQRAVVRASFKDHRWPDTAEGFDKYFAERAYDPATQGTFWGKFRARQPYLSGRPLRLIRGSVGEELAAMETRHYFMEAFDGPDTDGHFALAATDILKLADDDRAQAPMPNTGFLSAAIDSSVTSATLAPAGIGDIEYPASGHVAIGGSEICAFTRAGDVLTLTRAQLGTPADSHAEDDRVQLVLSYSGEDAADIIYDLLTNYAGIDGGTGGVINLDNWIAETAAHLGVLFSAVIAEPVGVSQLASELIEQAALMLWWDDIGRQIRLRVIRPVDADAKLFDAETILRDSLSTVEQPEKRVSQVWTYYGRRNPLKPLTELENYASVHISVDLQAEADYGTPAIRKILARWIPAFGSPIAERLSDLHLARFGDPPRRIQFAFLRTQETVGLGDGCRVGGWSLQDDTGAPAMVPVQVIGITPHDDRIEVETEEMSLRAIPEADLTDRVITIDTHFNDFNLRTVHDQLFPEITAQDVTNGVTLTCIVAAGVIVGATSAGTVGHAFEMGDWPSGLPITLVLRGRIQGKGGDGGKGGRRVGVSEVFPTGGQTGGTALYTRVAIDIELHAMGELWGGGGGGPGAAVRFSNPGGGGGAGQGQTPSMGGTATSPAQPGEASTPEAPGDGGSGTDSNPGGDGGGPGLPGGDAFGSATIGAAGRAIDGVSFVTFTLNDGDRAGPEVN